MDAIVYSQLVGCNSPKMLLCNISGEFQPPSNGEYTIKCSVLTEGHPPVGIKVTGYQITEMSVSSALNYHRCVR